ncbi:MAG: hypothetical protein FJ403_15555 [Verrucomicrobia bacterium]|nr:hypothetical protein [Verrucomicrobiota bacterium]
MLASIRRRETPWKDDSVEVFVDAENANDANWNRVKPGGQYVIMPATRIANWKRAQRIFSALFSPPSG